MWAEIFYSTPHFLHSGLSISPVRWAASPNFPSYPEKFELSPSGNNIQDMFPTRTMLGMTELLKKSLSTTQQ
jgi:hypothetical protein